MLSRPSPKALVIVALLESPGCGSSCPATPSGDLIIYTDAVASGDGTTELHSVLASCGGAGSSGEGEEYAGVGCGDKMFVTSSDGFRGELTPGFDGPNPSFTGRLETDAEDTEIEIRLVRPEFEDPPVGRSTMPPPFELTSPLPTEPVSRSTDSLEIRWAPMGASDPMGLRVDLSACTAADFFDVPDTGVFRLATNRYSIGGTCQTTLRLRRFRDVNIPGCGESAVYAAQERAIPITSAP
jgi:hypothetical protein